MDKVYERINWEDEPSISTPLAARLLNRVDYATNEIDNRVIVLDTGKANQVDELLDIKEVTYNSTTGVWTFTHQNGTVDTFDQNIEKIPVTFSMDENGVITMTTADGTTYTCDVGTLIKTYTFVNSENIQFTVTTDEQGNKSVTANVIDGSITRSKLDPDYLAQIDLSVASASASATAAGNSATAASGSATTASNKALDSEAYAIGTRNGTPVTSDDPAYENNSKYYAEHGASSLVGLTDTNISNPTDKQALVYDETSNKWVNADIEAGSLENLTDVDITNPEEGDIFTYNGETEKWENKQSVIGNTSDATPYLTRETNNGNRVGSKRVVKDLVGGSVVANQLLKDYKSLNTNGWDAFRGTVALNNDEVTLTCTNDNGYSNYYNNTFSKVSGHKYLVSLSYKVSKVTSYDIRFGSQSIRVTPSVENTYEDAKVIITSTETGDNLTVSSPYGSGTKNGDIITIKNYMIIDLTTMFGTTVADTLYSMEQATAGNGVALFRQLFSNDYYDYQTGSLVSVKPSAMVSGGKTYPISEVDLRGLLSLSNSKWVYDGDIRTCGGEITRKYGIVDLGTLNWVLDLNSNFMVLFKLAKAPSLPTLVANLLCAKYITTSSNNTFSIDKSVGLSSGSYVRIHDSTYTDAQTFKTAMSGVYLIYELATPTTEYVPAFSEIQDATENGTESFTDARTFPMPVAHHTDYPYGEISNIIFDVPNTRERQNITNRLGDLSKAIAEQNLEKYGYKIGDYFLGTEQTPYVYTLADLDTFYGGYSRNAIVNEHHLGVVVDTRANSKWDTTDASNGYVNSTLHTYLTGDVLNNIKADMIARFGGSTGLEHLISNSKLLTTGLNTWSWSSSVYISALTEAQVCGFSIFSGNNKQQGEGDTQLELFRKYKYSRVFSDSPIWLRSISSTSLACGIDNGGHLYAFTPTNSYKAVGLILLK